MQEGIKALLGIDPFREKIEQTGKHNFKSMLSNRPAIQHLIYCLVYTWPSPRDRQKSRMPSSA